MSPNSDGLNTLSPAETSDVLWAEVERLRTVLASRTAVLGEALRREEYATGEHRVTQERLAEVRRERDGIAKHSGWIADRADTERRGRLEAEAERDALKRKVEALAASYEPVAADAMAHGLCAMRENGIIQRAEKAEAAIERARQAAEGMRTWCSPYGVFVRYADHILAALDAPHTPTEAQR